jgi:hypothetical protein
MQILGANVVIVLKNRDDENREELLFPVHRDVT